MHPYLVAQMAEEHNKDLLAHARRAHLAAAIAPPATLRQRVGEGLIAVGERLACRSKPIGHSVRSS